MTAQNQQTESKPALYRLVRAVISLAMAVFFRKIELRHGEHVPATGPVVFVANHPNSIMDALVIGVVTRRKVNYIGHAGLFSSALKTWFLRSTGVIPVYRREDAPDKMEQNVSMFQACFEALESGETIGIFPEGTSDMLRRVKKLKTGAARIILEAERRTGYKLGLTVLPVGLYFFSRHRFRSRVLVNVGAPIQLADFFRQNEDDNPATVQALTETIQKRLQKITVNIEHEDLDELVSDIDHLYREELAADTIGLSHASKATMAEFFLTQKIADCVQHYYSHDPEKLRAIRARIESYKRKLKKLHLKDAMLKEKVTSRQLFLKSAVSFGKSLAALPIAAYGIINNLLPYAIAENAAKKFVDERTKILSALLIGGGLAFLFFYTLQTSLVWLLAGELWAAVYFASLPLSGFFALAFLRVVREEQERISLTFFLFTNKQMFNKMRLERRRLISNLNDLRDEYLTATRRSAAKA